LLLHDVVVAIHPLPNFDSLSFNAVNRSACSAFNTYGLTAGEVKEKAKGRFCGLEKCAH
jgi:hypothetical protein